MSEQSTGTGVESRHLWNHLEEFVRGHIKQFVQRLLVDEVTMRLGRAKSARRAAVDAPEEYRNGYGKPRKLALTCGTITVQRPRVRGLARLGGLRGAELQRLPARGNNHQAEREARS